MNRKLITLESIEEVCEYLKHTAFYKCKIVKVLDNKEVYDVVTETIRRS
jgi:hypothetical protein